MAESHLNRIARLPSTVPSDKAKNDKMLKYITAHTCDAGTLSIYDFTQIFIRSQSSPVFVIAWKRTEQDEMRRKVISNRNVGT